MGYLHRVLGNGAPAAEPSCALVNRSISMGTMYKYGRSDTWSATLKAIVMPGGHSQFYFDIVTEGFSLYISLIRKYHNAVDHNRTYGFLQDQLLYNKNKDTQDGEVGGGGVSLYKLLIQ